MARRRSADAAAPAFVAVVLLSGEAAAALERTPTSVEALVRERAPGARRIEFCRTERHIVVRAGWEPIAAGCEARDGDRIVALD